MNRDIIGELKNKYSHIYSVTDEDGAEYFFRALTLIEVKIVENFIALKLKNSFELENYCLEQCLLYPIDIDLDDLTPGLAKQIAEQVLVVSGIADAEQIVKSLIESRQRLSTDIILDIKSYIISAMPSYTDDELNKFTLLELIEKLVLSEKILTLQAQLAGVDAKVELAFEYADAAEEYEVVKKTNPSSKQKQQPSKEELIKRITKDNIENYSSKQVYTNPNASKEWQGFDLDLLEKMEGVKDIRDDPIARKLHGLE